MHVCVCVRGNNQYLVSQRMNESKKVERERKKKAEIELCDDQRIGQIQGRLLLFCLSRKHDLNPPKPHASTHTHAHREKKRPWHWQPMGYQGHEVRSCLAWSFIHRR